MVALVDRRSTRAYMTPGTFNKGRISAGMAINAIATGCGRSRMVHLRSAVLGQTVVTAGTSQVGSLNGAMTSATVVTIVSDIGRGGMVHGRAAVLGLGGMTGSAVEASNGDTGVALVATQTVAGGSGMVPLGKHRYVITAGVTFGALEAGEGYANMAIITGLCGKGRIHMMHGRRTITGLALVAGSAIKAAGGYSANSKVTGATEVVNRRGRGVVHYRGAVFHRLSRMTSFTGTGNNRCLSTGVTLGTVVAVVYLVGRRSVMHSRRTILHRLGVMATGTIKSNSSFVTEDTVVASVSRVGVMHGRRTVIDPAGMTAGAIEACNSNPRVTGRTEVIDSRIGIMMHSRRTIFY